VVLRGALGRSPRRVDGRGIGSVGLPLLAGVDGVPGRLAALDADAAEGHVGEVDAEADGVGYGEFEDEAVAEAGGLLAVVVEGVSQSGWVIWMGEWKASPKAITRCTPASMT
jgi:hypothetical protein